MNKVTRRITMTATLAALAVILDSLSIRTPFNKTTLLALPLLLCGIIFDWKHGLLCGFVSGLILQLVIPIYGISITFPLWMIAPMLWGMMGGLLYKWLKKLPFIPRIIILVYITSIFVTLANTGAWILDGIILEYDYAFVIAGIVNRIMTSLVIAIIYSLVLIIVVPRLEKIYK